MIMPAPKTMNLAVVLVVGAIAVSGLFTPNLAQARTLTVSQESTELAPKAAFKQQATRNLFLKCLPLLNLPIALGIAVFLIHKSKI